MTTQLSSRHQILPPPVPPGPVKWIRENLFGNLFNSILTILSSILLYLLLSKSIQWIFVDADWRPVANFPLLYTIGQYPRDQIWRVGASLSLAMFLLGVSWGKWGGLLRSVSITAMLLFALAAFVPFQEEQITAAIRMNLGSNIIIILAGFLIGKVKWVKPGLIGISWLVLPILVMVLFSGFDDSEILPKVPTTSWGGLMVTFLLAFGGILLSFPIGVALALGRRSTLPVVSTFSTVFIETIRGVPLITILFMFSVILALFLPQESRLDRLLRALIALTVFSSAYMAENIRGGLQSIPSGQIEAAKAIGMTGFQTMSFIVLPQALRAVIPAIVGQFIGLFKDTTLVVIVGLNDFLGIGKSIISADPAFLLLQTEVYIFIAFVYWIFSYLMSLASRRVETALGVGYR